MLPNPASRVQWRSRSAAVAWITSAVGILAFGGGLIYATAGDIQRQTRVLPPRPPEVMRDVIVRRAEDLMGRRASFRILLFTDEFRWRLNSSDALDNTPPQPHFTPEMKAVLNDAKEVICVGASSEETPGGLSFERGRHEEEQRAARRAEQIALWVRQAVSRPIPVRKLNIGHHMPTHGARDTSNQRRVVIILVLDRDERTNIDQALRAAMAEESVRAPVFEALLTQYSLTTAPSFTWVD
jgi:hypothetical protein